jgi:transposase
MGKEGAKGFQRLPEMEKLADTLVNHIDGIAAYCDHPVRFGVVGSLNTTIKATPGARVACAMTPCSY